jgi:HK97 family phage portal protein
MAGWLSRILGARRSRERHDPEITRIPFQGRTLAGVYVDPDRALTNSVVWACVGYLSSTVAQLPWEVKQDLGEDGSKVMPRHPVANVLQWRPNPEWSPFQFRETLVGWALLRGNGYAEIVRDAAGRVAELWPIHPDKVEVKRDTATDALFYEVETADGKIDMDPMDIFHLRGFGDGPVGLNVAEYAAQSIGWAQAAELFGASFFGNGMNLGGFIEVKSGLSADGKSRLRSELDKLHRGPRNANKWGILDAEMTAKKLAATPDEAQFVATMQHQVETLCRWFRVPPHKVMHLLRGTFSNIEHQSIEVVVDSVTPWVARLEQEADYKLFGSNRQGLFSDIDLTGLLRGDASARGTYYQMMRNVGAINANEIRSREGMNPIGADGDKYVMQGQYTTLDMLGQEPAPAPAAPAAPAPEPQEDTPAQQAAAWRISTMAAALDVADPETVDAV